MIQQAKFVQTKGTRDLPVCGGCRKTFATGSQSPTWVFFGPKTHHPVAAKIPDEKAVCLSSVFCSKRPNKKAAKSVLLGVGRHQADQISENESTGPLQWNPGKVSAPSDWGHFAVLGVPEGSFRTLKNSPKHIFCSCASPGPLVLVICGWDASYTIGQQIGTLGPG